MERATLSPHETLVGRPRRGLRPHQYRCRQCASLMRGDQRADCRHQSPLAAEMSRKSWPPYLHLRVMHSIFLKRCFLPLRI